VAEAKTLDKKAAQFWFTMLVVSTLANLYKLKINAGKLTLAERAVQKEKDNAVFKADYLKLHAYPPASSLAKEARVHGPFFGFVCCLGKNHPFTSTPSGMALTSFFLEPPWSSSPLIQVTLVSPEPLRRLSRACSCGANEVFCQAFDSFFFPFEFPLSTAANMINPE